MTIIYALHSVGDDEIRYIGRTEKSLQSRLAKHRNNAGPKCSYPPKISEWIKSVDYQIEIVALRECDAGDALKEERQAVHHYYNLGHRLTNSHLVPRARGEKAA